MKNIKPLSVSGNDTRVEFTLDDGTVVTQTIAGVPVEDAEAARAFLKDYATALEAGLELQKEKAAPPTPASGLIGVKFTVDRE